MPTRPAGHVVRRAAPARPSAAAPRKRARPHPRVPSTVGYLVVTGGLSAALFFLIWIALRAGGEEAPWVAAGLAAGLVVVLAAAAREVVMRRAWARHAREMELAMGGFEQPRLAPRKPARVAGFRGWRASVAELRGLQQRLAELDAPDTPPEAHLEAYRLCELYLARADELLQSSGGPAEMRVAVRSGQERLRVLRRKHLLGWARGEATRLTREARRRVSFTDKIETAQRALEVLEEALGACPGEPELRDSAAAVRDFIASVRVGRWVEMAERAAFRGRHARAVARYRDALFYLERAEMGEAAREEAAARIRREIELLRARPAADGGHAEGGGLEGRARRRPSFETEL